MVLAFGGIVFFLVAIVLVAVVAWAAFGYLTGTAEAADEGIDAGTSPARRTASGLALRRPGIPRSSRPKENSHA